MIILSPTCRTRRRGGQQFKTILLNLLLVASLTPLVCAQEAPPSVRLDKIEVTGLERLTTEQVIAESGLQIGQTVNPDMLDAAANRLMETGQFKKLSYRFSAKSGQGVATFVVEEMKSSVPVVFDNFVWFANEELLAAIRKYLPAFDGTAPEAGNATATITKALAELLHERKITGTVVYTPSASLSGQSPAHVFSVKDANLRVCTLKYPGASAVPETLLVQNSSGLFNNEYSRAYAIDYALSNLIPLFHERGYLRANFRAPEVKLEKRADCENGVALTLPVEEGSAYVWSRAEWTGNAGLTPQELDAALGMKPREIANGVKIDKGIEAVRKAYSRRGYLAPNVVGTPEFDDGERSVSYRFNVTEGAQYRMGELIIEGLSEKDTNNLRTRWRLMPREVYDALYVDEFLRTGFREFIKDLRSMEGRTLPAFKLETSQKPNREKMTVDVTINIKPDSSAPVSQP